MTALVNIYRMELKRNRRAAISWTAVIGLLIVFYTAFYPSIYEASEQMEAMLEIYPKAFLRAFDINSIDSLTNVLGFYVTYNGMFVMVLGGIFSAVMASNIVIKEERDRTAEFLLSKPATRGEVWAGKLGAYLTYLSALNLIITGVGALSIELFSEMPYDGGAYLTFAFYAFLAMLAFGAIGVFLSILMRRGKSMTGIAVGVVLAAYFLDRLSRIAQKADGIGYVSPFKFIDTDVLALDYGFEPFRLAYFVAVTVLLLAASAIIFRRKDIVL